MPVATPFDGLRVVVLDPTPAVAMTGWLMRQMGAAVTVAEPAGGGALREQPPFVRGRGAVFEYLAAGASGVLLPDPAAPLPAEFADAHVIVHGYVDFPQAWADTVASTPVPERGRVVVACTPYGQSGPRRDWSATELVLFQAGGEGYLMPSGLAFEQFPDRSPIGVGRYLAHYQGGLSAGVAALAGLRTSRRTRSVGWADVSIQDIEISLNYFTVSRLVEGVREDRTNRAFTYGGVLECDDGFVELVTLEQRQWEALREMLGRPEWATNPAMDDAVSRGEHGDEINRYLRAWMRTRTVREVVELGAEFGVPCGPYLSPGQLLDEPQLAAREFFRSGPDGRAPGPPWRLTGWSATDHRPAPPVPTRTGASA